MIHIIGSGPSRAMYSPQEGLVISINFPYLNSTMLASNHLQSYGWQPYPTITGISYWDAYEDNMNYPGHKVAVPGLNKYTWDKVYVQGLNVFMPEHPSIAFMADSGAVAIIWALHTYPNELIHLWGFDSIWDDSVRTKHYNPEHKLDYWTDESFIKRKKTLCRLIKNKKITWSKPT
jgi:hypothetical protein